MIRFVPNPLTIRSEPLRMAHNHVRETCRQIKNMSRRRAPFNTTGWRRPGPRLKYTIDSDVRVTGLRVHGEVGSHVGHAHVAHDGARPHQIRPRAANGKLAFYWTRQGKWVSFPRVSHPGMEGVNYLTGPLMIVGTRRGYRVVIHR